MKRIKAHLLKPVGGSKYLAQAKTGTFIVCLTCSQFLSIYDNGGTFLVSEKMEFLTGVEK